MVILGEFKISVKKSLSEINSNYRNFKGLVVCGTHNTSVYASAEIIEEIRKARENKIPFLGICHGHQLAAIEYALNVLGIDDAASEEFNSEGNFIVKKLPELNVGLIDGESYWNNYEVRSDFYKMWKKPSHMISVQYHPEYQSSKDNPHPVLVKFLELCKSE